MKFSINQQSFSYVLNVVNKAILKKGYAPSLSCVYIEADENEVLFRTSNMEFSIMAYVPALVEEDGNTLLNARLLLNIVENFPDEAVCIDVNDKTAEISCGKAEFDIRVMNTDDFPDFPEVTAIKKLDLPFGIVSEMIKKVAKITSKDDSRPIMQGINIVVKENSLKLVATDGYRIAQVYTNINNTQNVEINTVLPCSFMQDIASLKSDNDKIVFSLSENQVVVEYSNMIFVNRKIAGKFPKYEYILNKDFKMKAKVNTKKLIDAVKRISVLDSLRSLVKFEFDPINNILCLSGAAQDIGSGEESFTCSFEKSNNKEKQNIAFNCNYILDGISSIKSKNVIIEIDEDKYPGIFSEENTSDYKYILSPVKFE